MKLRLPSSRLAAAILVASTACGAFPSQSVDSTDLASVASTSLAGYLGVFFLGDAPNAFFYLSDGSNPLTLKALNKGSPILQPTGGTKGVRDPSVSSETEQKMERKWYIISTDLDIGKMTWEPRNKIASQSIHIRESTDLIAWGMYRLVKTEDHAGHGLSSGRDLGPGERAIIGAAGPDRIRYAYTPDSLTFSMPRTFISYAPTPIIDLCIPPLSASTFVRFVRNESIRIHRLHGSIY
ncbi:hypothetical protein F5882DRAFT_466250 [Hyaloscypha sp. PMI_1271]|nr:hypothetical protein F5882DRAFT_466250 [Hyaloscypha sp. PMI_1271]